MLSPRSSRPTVASSSDRFERVPIVSPEMSFCSPNASWRFVATLMMELHQWFTFGWVLNKNIHIVPYMCTPNPETYSPHIFPNIFFSITVTQYIGRHKSSTHSWRNHPLGWFTVPQLRHTRWRSRPAPSREPTCPARGVSRWPVHP